MAQKYKKSETLSKYPRIKSYIVNKERKSFYN